MILIGTIGRYVFAMSRCPGACACGGTYDDIKLKALVGTREVFLRAYPVD